MRCLQVKIQRHAVFQTITNGHAGKEGAAQLVALRNRAENRKEFLRQKAGAIFSLKVLSRTGFDRGRMRSLGSGCR